MFLQKNRHRVKLLTAQYKSFSRFVMGLASDRRKREVLYQREEMIFIPAAIANSFGYLNPVVRTLFLFQLSGKLCISLLLLKPCCS